ncbi:MAG: two-component regulator propeller domain-containing protein, partial [Bacteroidales bacterium]|nr:two-component regulator propeller domain-containing protein [Bacteroidales bacterium]
IEENVQYRDVLSKTVYALHCDSQSKLWVAGDHGLACLVFDEQGNIAGLYSLNMLTVLALCEDYYGRIWLATSSGKLQCLSNKNPGQFDFEIVPDLLQRETFNFIRCIYTDRMGSLWIASSLGLFRYNPHTDLLQEYVFSENEPGSLPHSFVNDVVQDNIGNIWVATLGGLALWNQASDNFTRFQSDDADESINNNFLNTLFADDRNILWIGTEKGGVNWMFEKRKMIHAIRYHPEDPGSLSPGPVNSILEDSKGNLWVGLVEGGLHFRAKGQEAFQHYLHSGLANSISQNTVSKIYEDADSHIWLGTWGGGLNRLDPSGSGFESFVPGDEKGSIASLFVSDVIEDSLHNGLWVGMNNGLQFFDQESEQFLNVFVGSEMPYPPQQVNFLKIDRKQRLWVATNIGLYCFYLSTFDIPGVPAKYDYFRYSLHDPSSGQLAKIISIYEDEDVLWFGSNGDGLYKMEECSLADDGLDIKKKPGWGGPDVYETAESYVHFIHYDKRQGFADNVIYTILEDDNDRLWMSTNNGLIRFDPQSQEVVSFSKDDGLLSNQFYWMAACKGSEGILYFGNLQGLNYIEPGRFKNNNYMPSPGLVTLQILNNKIEPGVAFHNKVYLEKHLFASSELVIPKKDKSFSLEFSALDYEFPERIRYAYYLEGFDEQWTSVGPERRFVYYTNLKQGRYVFRLRCTNSDGVWSDKITSLPIVIRPPFYQSLPFHLVLIFMLLGFSLLVVMSRENRIKRKRAELEAKVKARTLELQEANRQVEALNQEKLSVFTNITHEFKTPISLIIGPLKRMLNLSKDPQVLDQLKLAERNAERLLALVNQLMDFRKVEEKACTLYKSHGNLLDLVREVLLPFADAVEKRFIHCSLISRLKNPELIFDAEILRKILSNLLSNAVKYTPDYGSIKIKLFDIQKNNADWIRITVSDSGIGIPEEESEKIFERFYQIKEQQTYQVTGQSGTGVGLFLCRELAQIHGGIIYATNNRLGGARFVLEIPAEFFSGSVENAESIVSSYSLNDEEESLRVNAASAETESRSKPLLLVVEDNKDMRQYLASVL